MHWRDVDVLVARSFELDAQASRDSENLAMLVDRDDYWLNAEYSSWITDPEDPQVKAERARRKRLGIKPPPLPVIPPIALRGEPFASERRKQFDAVTAAKPPAPSGERVTVAELIALQGI